MSRLHGPRTERITVREFQTPTFPLVAGKAWLDKRYDFDTLVHYWHDDHSDRLVTSSLLHEFLHACLPPPRARSSRHPLFRLEAGIQGLDKRYDFDTLVHYWHDDHSDRLVTSSVLHE